MSLVAIREYLKQRGQLSVQEVAIHFDITPEAAQLGLEYWAKKGKARVANGCGSECCSCGSDAVAKTIYTWVERAIPLKFYRNSSAVI
jgi:DeoR/GlpR family transcriptional regulator of sugar metabolism